MRTYVLQDWTTLTGTSSVTSVKQSEEGWLALDGARDAQVWFQLAEATTAASPTLYVETSPTTDDSLFVTMTQLAVSSMGVYLKVVRARGATQPLSTYCRWKVGIGTATTWSLTFRILLSINFVRPDFSALQGGIPAMEVG